MHFSKDWLIRLMDRRLLTHGEIAEMVGVNRNTVYRWTSGRMQPSKKHIRKLAEVLGVDPDVLLEEDEGIPMVKSRY